MKAFDPEPLRTLVVGFDGVAPFTVYAPQRMSEEKRSAELTRYRQRLLGFEQAPLLPNPPWKITTVLG